MSDEQESRELWNDLRDAHMKAAMREGRSILAAHIVGEIATIDAQELIGLLAANAALAAENQRLRLQYDPEAKHSWWIIIALAALLITFGWWLGR